MNIPPSDGLTGVGSSLSAHSKREALRASIVADAPVMVPGVTDAMGVRLVERAGFAAAYATGAGLANAQFGLPDIGLISQAEVIEHVGRLTAAGDIPIVADADTGYGGPLNAMRTVRMLERMGVAGIQLEDQEMPKRCGHFDSHSLIDAGHMQSKIAAAVDAREDPALVIVARTDARGVLGIHEAIERGKAYAAAGADALFIEAPETVEELALVGKELAAFPLIVNVVEGGKTPHLTTEQYGDLGFSVVLHANFLMRSMMKAGEDALVHLSRNGESISYTDRITGWAARQELVNLPEFSKAEAFYDQEWSDR